MTHPNPPELNQLRDNLSTTLYNDDIPIEIPRRRSWLRSLAARSPLATASAAVVGLAGVGIAVAATVSGGVTPAQFNQGQRAQPATSVPAAAASSFSVLGSSVTSSDALPSAYVASHQNSALVGELGANLKLAHLVPGVTDGAVWVVPTDSGVCLIVSQYNNGQITGAGCTTEKAAANGKIVFQAGGSTQSSAGEFIAGLVPNGVSSVSLVLANGETTSLPVHDNVYTAHVTSGTPSTVTFAAAGGSTDTVKLGADG
jgi:hypothetical protein